LLDKGKVIPIRLEDEMKKSYIDYAMSVIVGRALPDVRDGLKPVHRRILYAMYEAGMTPDKPYKKSARVVGDVMARYHPHGDAAIYDAMVRMAQDFSIRYPLIDGHGNFGSIDGDAAAAMRYTEARLSPIAMEMLRDIDKETVDFVPNYDESLKEPTVLPSRIPNILINGSSGIAVGMATNIPPHNLGEVIDALIMIIENPDATPKELMTAIKGPDFPTGGIIMGRRGIEEAYQKGRGSIVVRAKATIEELENGRSCIYITEIPYQVNKARLIEKIAELVRNKKIDGISDLRDESDRKGLQVTIELRRGVNPKVILNQLYKHTQLEEKFGIILLALVDGEPKTLSLKDILVHYLEHQKDIVTRKSQYELRRAEERAHIVEGLRIALMNLDAVIKIIRSSKDIPTARNSLMEKFSLTEKQAQAILDMRLQKLTGLEREKLEEEYQELLKTIEYLKKILADQNLLMGVIKEDLLQMKEKYGDPRRTQITAAENEIDIEDLIHEEDVVITITHKGYIKRMPLSSYKSQKRGGKGIVGITTAQDDTVEHIFIANTHHYLLFFTNKGKCYRLKVHEIPEAGRQARGQAIVNLLYFEQNEWITAVIPIRQFVKDRYLFMATQKGFVKKTELLEYNTSRRDGIRALNLEEGDELIGVKLTDGRQDVILATKMGLAIRFSEEEVRAMGRTARGVKGISLKEGDTVVGLELIRPGTDILVVTHKGYGKRTPSQDYRKQGRGGKGIITLKVTHKNGYLAAVQTVKEQDEVMLITQKGIINRQEISGIPRQSRSTQGVRLIRLDDDDRVVSVARLMPKTTQEVEEQRE